ncbi:MAG: glycerol kinase GlpK [Candidatus Brocadiia bacterium]
MPEDLILSIDSGTTGTRAMVFDREHNVSAAAYQEFPQIFPRPGWVEHNPDDIWQSTMAVVREVIDRVNPARLCGIGITNQRETALLWDRETGDPVHNAIVWQCRRTADRCRELADGGHGADIHRKTGLQLDPYFSATKWEWLLENVSEARELVKDGRLAAGTVDTWLLWKLTGGRVHATEPSNASRTSLFNIRELAWDEGLCDLFNVPMEALPEVLPTSGRFGRADPETTGLDLPVLAMVGDQQAASFGQGCFRPGTVKNTCGTGLFMLCNTGTELIVTDSLLSTVAWSFDDRTDYALEGSVLTGGAAVQWLRDGIGIIEDAGETAAMAASLGGNDDVYFVPALSGLGAPYWDAAARGTIVGITRGTTRAHLARATLEAIAYRSRDVLEVMVEEAGWGPEVLRVDGGAIANEFLMQFMADVLGMPVEVPTVSETTALGAAGLAGLAAGLWEDGDDFLSRRGVERVYEPRMSADQRDALYARWRQAVERARDWA